MRARSRWRTIAVQKRELLRAAPGVVVTDVPNPLGATGQEVWFNGPDAFVALMKADTQKFGQIIRTANIKLE